MTHGGENKGIRKGKEHPQQKRKIKKRTYTIKEEEKESETRKGGRKTIKKIKMRCKRE